MLLQEVDSGQEDFVDGPFFNLLNRGTFRSFGHRNVL